MVNISIREYQPSDQAACLEVFRSNFPHYFSEEDLDEYLEFLNDPEDRQNYLVLEKDQKIVGCGGYYVVHERGWGGLSFGMLDQSVHGTGLGKRLLLERLYRLSQVPEVGSIYLDTSQHTFGFFEKFGFVTQEITPDGYGGGLDRYDMKLILDAAVRQRIQSAYKEHLP